MMMKQKTPLVERLNIGNETRELKLGCTFNAKNTTNAFHTIKYDFKPASVDKNRVATVDIGSNNQVTVTVPNLVTSNSGVPHTIYKGNQKKYTKECILIYDKETGDITIERLNHNIQVKKTRDITNINLVESVGRNVGPKAASASSATTRGATNKYENSTMRVTSKTKVSTGSRRNKIIELKGGNSNVHNNLPARNNTNKKPTEAAPIWNANNGQSTLPSIPMIVDDDDIFGLNSNNGAPRGSITSTSANSKANAGVSSVSKSQKYFNNNVKNLSNVIQQRPQKTQTAQPQCGVEKRNNQAKQNRNQQKMRKKQSTPRQQQALQTKQEQGQQQQQQLLQKEQEQVQEWQRQLHQQQQYNRSTNNNVHDKKSSQPIPISSANWHNTNQPGRVITRTSSTSNNSTPQDFALSPTLAIEAAALEMNIVSDLSSSSSSTDSTSSSTDSSDTDSDSDNDEKSKNNCKLQQQPQPLNQLPNLSLGILTSPSPSSMTKPTFSENQNRQQHQSNYTPSEAFPNDLLQSDLQLSSNSSDDETC